MTFTPQEFEIINRAVAIAETLAKDTRCPLDWVAEAHEARLLLLGAQISVPQNAAPQPFPHGRWTPKEVA